MDVSHGLLEKLLHRDIINYRHYQVMKVSAFESRCFCWTVNDLH